MANTDDEPPPQSTKNAERAYRLPEHALPMPLTPTGSANASRVGLDPVAMEKLKVRPPTLRQLEVLSRLAELLAEPGAPLPTFRVLADRIGARSLRTLTSHLCYLRRRGLVTQDDSTTTYARRGSLAVTDVGYAVLAAWTPPPGMTCMRIA